MTESNYVKMNQNGRVLCLNLTSYVFADNHSHQVLVLKLSSFEVKPIYCDVISSLQYIFPYVQL